MALRGKFRSVPELFGSGCATAIVFLTLATYPVSRTVADPPSPPPVRNVSAPAQTGVLALVSISVLLGLRHVSSRSKRD